MTSSTITRQNSMHSTLAQCRATKGVHRSQKHKRKNLLRASLSICECRQSHYSLFGGIFKSERSGNVHCVLATLPRIMVTASGTHAGGKIQKTQKDEGRTSQVLHAQGLQVHPRTTQKQTHPRCIRKTRKVLLRQIQKQVH